MGGGGIIRGCYCVCMQEVCRLCFLIHVNIRLGGGAGSLDTEGHIQLCNHRKTIFKQIFGHLMGFGRIGSLKINLIGGFLQLHLCFMFNHNTI